MRAQSIYHKHPEYQVVSGGALVIVLSGYMAYKHVAGDSEARLDMPQEPKWTHGSDEIDPWIGIGSSIATRRWRTLAKPS